VQNTGRLPGTWHCLFWDCPLPGSAQGQVGWSSEQPGLVEDVPAHGRGVGTRDLYDPFQPKPFYDSMQMEQTRGSVSAFECDTARDWGGAADLLVALDEVMGMLLR